MTVTAGFKFTSTLAAAVVLSLATITTANAACSDPAAPGVDWSGCVKKNAELVRADLSGADLGGAHLYEAKLGGANLTGADLSGAISPEGYVCAKGSIGTCNQ